MEPHEPTPEEIKDACEKIQEGWSEQDRKKRAGQVDNGGWTPPEVKSPEFLEDDVV